MIHLPDQITDCIIMFDVLRVFMQKASIYKKLSVVLEGNDISNKGDVKEHVSAKCNSSWRVPIKRRTASTATCMHGCSKCFFNDCIGSWVASRDNGS